MGYNLSAAQFFAQRGTTLKALGKTAKPVKKPRAQHQQNPEETTTSLYHLMLLATQLSNSSLLFGQERSLVDSLFMDMVKFATEHGLTETLTNLFGDLGNIGKNLGPIQFAALEIQAKQSLTTFLDREGLGILSSLNRVKQPSLFIDFGSIADSPSKGPFSLSLMPFKLPESS